MSWREAALGGRQDVKELKIEAVYMLTHHLDWIGLSTSWQEVLPFRTPQKTLKHNTLQA
jgi:hypothetical protein